MRKPAPVHTTLSLTFNQNIQAVFELLAHPDVAPRFIPGVISSTLLDGNWKQVGARRRLELEGGATVLETIKTFEAPNAFTYELSEITGLPRIAHHAIERGHSTCYFLPIDENGTRVIWRFSFAPRRYRHVPLLFLYMKTLHRRTMGTAARNILREGLVTLTME